MGDHKEAERLRKLAQLAREVANVSTEGGLNADRRLVQLAGTLEFEAAALERGEPHRDR